MFFYRIIYTIIFVSFLFSGCKKSDEVTNNNDSQKLNKSPKRGVAYNLTSEADMSALKSGISWWYNWGTFTSAQKNYYNNYEMEFIPMLWGGNTSNNDMLIVRSFILEHGEIKYLLVMNEPNLTDQANRTPGQAASDWLKYEKVVSDLAASGRTIYLVGPAITWGTMSGYSDPVAWLDAFYAAYRTANQNRDPAIDYLAFHWYDYGLSAQLDRLNKYGKKIWITEMANWNTQINSYAKQKEQMKDMINTCEIRSDVFRYAWFIGRGNFPDQHFTYLFTSEDGQLNELGQYYLSLPYNE